MIDFDIESTGLQPWSGKNEAFLWIFMGDDEAPEAIPFTPSGDPIPGWPGAEADRDKNHARIQWWFDRARQEGIRAWNSKFDWAFADTAGCFDLPGDGMWHDGMLEAHAIDERRSLALKAVAVELFGADAADPQKALKEWLNAENRRRAKVMADAEKARQGVLKVKYTEEYTTKDGEAKTRNKTRLANEEEVASLLAEAAELDAGAEGYKRANYSHVPREIMEPYALEDVILTRKVNKVYGPRLEAMADLHGTVEFERKALDALYGIEKRGLPAKAVEYRKLEQEVIANITKLSEKVAELAMEGDPIVYAKTLAGQNWGKGKKWIEVSEDGQIVSYEGGAARLDEFSPGSSQQILAALKARGANMDFMSQEDGKVSADAENLRAVPDDLAAAILEYRTEAKVLSTYVRPMIGRSYVSSMNVYKEPFIAPDSRIHANYRQIGAQKTGRMSCSDPNMQNQPRDDLRLRYNVVADPGHVLITCDLSNIEMVLFAAYCGPGRLLTAVRNGDDLHVMTAEMLGLRDRARPGGGVETARQLGKTYNFSRIYGGGLRTIRRSFRCSLEHARLLKRRFDDAYPEVQTLQTRIDYRLQDDGYIQDKLISGRRFRVDPKQSYKAVNYLVQGTAASLLKDAVISLHADGVPMVALVHDEIVAHVRSDEAADVAALIEKRMTQASSPGGQLWIPEHKEKRASGPNGLGEKVEVTVPAGPVVPLRAEADIVTRWSDAKPLKDADGVAYYFDPAWAKVPRRYVDAA